MKNEDSKHKKEELKSTLSKNLPVQSKITNFVIKSPIIYHVQKEVPKHKNCEA